jgi:hypothetical protein
MRWVVYAHASKEEKCTQKFLKENLKHSPFGSWEDNIKTYLKEAGWKGVDWIHLAQDANKLLCSIKGRKYLKYLTNYYITQI